jgi:putative DNA primase/helicase
MIKQYSEDITKLETELEDLKPLVKKMQVEKKVDYFQQQILRKFDAFNLCKEFYDIQPFYYDKNKLYWIWDKQKCVWSIVDETDIIVAINNTFSLIGIATSSLKSQIINAIQIIGRDNTPLNQENCELIQFGTTIYNLNDGSSFEATPNYFITNTLPYTPSMSDDTPILDELFDAWVGRENRDLLYEIISYCCYRDYPIHHIFTFVGAGSNGKSKFLKIIEKFISVDNCASTSLDVLINSRFESANLFKKLVCTMGETNFNTMNRTEMLKRLSGQDLVGFEFKGKNSFSGYSYAKLLISTNTLPETTDRTDGFYRRWIIVDFPNRFSGDIDILKTIPESEFNNLSRKVLNILPNLLSYMRFTNVGTLEDRKKRYENKSNPLPKFLEEFTTNLSDGCIFKWEFNARYNDYLKQNNLRSQSDTEIGIKMKALDFVDRRITTDSGKTLRVWEGISWKGVGKLSVEEESILNAKHF